MDTPIALSAGRRRRRHHSAEFKAHVIAACCKPGVSSASVAMANGINANLVRRWVKEAEAEPQTTQQPGAAAGALTAKPSRSSAAKFVQLGMPASPTSPDIRIEVQRGASKVTVTWPAAAAAECAAWLREWLR